MSTQLNMVNFGQKCNGGLKFGIEVEFGEMLLTFWIGLDPSNSWLKFLQAIPVNPVSTSKVILHNQQSI